MVIVDDMIHVFASHKGGTGKTMLTFQCANEYATQHPDQNVLVIDFTELGDITKRFLGGCRQTEGQVEGFGAMFDLLDEASKEVPQKAVSRSFFSGLSNILRGQNNASVVEETIKFEESAVHPSDFNPAIPDNVFLVSSGAANFDDEERTPEKTKMIARNMRGALARSNLMWKVFVDTDGDRRPAPFTKIAYALSDRCVIPVQPDECDFARLEPMMRVMQKMYKNNEMDCRIQCLVWNKIQVYRKDPGPLGSFTPPKATSDMIMALNLRLYELAKEFDNIFVHRNLRTLEEFTRIATIMVRDFPDTVARPSSSNGIPFCQMRQGKIVTESGVEYTVKTDQIESCEENMKVVISHMQNTMEVE